MINCTPLFSVLIANYNNGQYLMEAIESVRTQTYPNWEIILVDDGSTDGSFSLYEKLKEDSRIHIYTNDENMGCGYTKRRCIEIAHGEYCGFVDADDKLEKEALSMMVNAFQQHPSCSLIYSKYYFSDSSLNIIHTSSHQCVIPPGKTFLTYNVPGAISHFVSFSRSLYLDTVGINPIMRRAVDIDLYLLLEEVGDVFFLPVPLYYYRTGTGKNISMGDRNLCTTLGWDVIAKTNACIRRGIPIEGIAFHSIEYAVENIKDNAFQEGVEKIKKTNAYRVGKTILRPYRWIKKRYEY